MQQNTAPASPRTTSTRLDRDVRNRIGILADDDLAELADIIGRAIRYGHSLDQLHAGIRAEATRRRHLYRRTGLADLFDAA